MTRDSKLRFSDEEEYEETTGEDAAMTVEDGGKRLLDSSMRARSVRGRRKKAKEREKSSSESAAHRLQKQALKKKYAEAKRAGKVAEEAAAAGEAEKQLTEEAKKAGQRFTVLLARHRRILLTVGALFLLTALLASVVSSCSVLLQGGLSVLGSTTFPCEDADMLGAEAVYAGKEAELQGYLENFESNHSYDEYHYDLDEIGHDPYVLISLLTAFHRGVWTLAEVEPTLDLLFDRQYTLTERVRTVTRYDSDGDPYSCTICTVTLRNFDLSHLPVYLLDEEQLSMYAGYMVNLGNRPDLFPHADYPNASVLQDVPRYQVPPEALADEQFAAMLTEAEKYLGFPYVWGGSNPSTSFDCSGYVSWVINHSGWDVGRLGALGLYNICAPVSPSEAKPGDLVFFRYTYRAPIPDAVTHVGIYVGGSMMIHCGNPIQYADLTKSYWQEHFYCFARLP